MQPFLPQARHPVSFMTFSRGRLASRRPLFHSGLETAYWKIPVFFLTFLVLFLAASGSALALEPAEILLIINAHSGNSRQIARHYIRKRGLPPENVVTLNCPGKDSISRREYERTIARPLKRILAMPGWAVKTKCLLLTMGIPLRIRATSMTHEEEVSSYKTRERIRALDELIKDPRTRKEARKRYRRQKRQLKRKLAVMNHQCEVASVDSELALVKLDGDYGLKWWVPNPLYLSGVHGRKGNIRVSQVLMVSRLDGPDLATVLRMIDDGIAAEKDGLNGTACFDCRFPRIPDGSLSAYQLYDKWLRLAAEVTRNRGIRTILDTRKALFAPGSCRNAILYCGWYSLARYVDAFDWQKGAVAYHIASGECTNLHAGGTQWCPMLLKDGVCATLGPVAEPYVQAFPPPHLFFRLVLNPQLSMAEIYILSCPYLSWRMVLLADPLYRPGLSLSRALH